MNRRTFVRRLGGGIALLAGPPLLLGLDAGRRGLSQAALAPTGQHPLRPPGALAEPAFRAACSRCHICAGVCKVGAIQLPEVVLGVQPQLPVPLGSSRRPMEPPRWQADGTPFVLPWKTACNLCMTCGEACPTGALTPIPADRASVARVRMGVARIDPKVCLPWTQVSWCGACLTICPFRGEAITVDHRSRPRIHAEHCVGCGLCVEVCPLRHKAVAVLPEFEPDSGRVRPE